MNIDAHAPYSQLPECPVDVISMIDKGIILNTKI